MQRSEALLAVAQRGSPRSYAGVFTQVLIAIAAAFLLSTAFTRVMAWLSTRLRFLDRPGVEAHKQHASAVPYGGGLAMAIAFAVGMALCPRIEIGAIDAMLDHARPIPIFIGLAVLMVVGLIDDRRPLPAWVKLAAQGAVAAAVIPTADIAIDSLQHGRWLACGPWLAYVATWLWIIMITNAYNLLDHADGMAGGVAVVSCAALLGGSLLDHDLNQAAEWMVAIAVLLGFLVWNLPPAKVYMGDAGSLPLGFLIATGTLSVTFWPSGVPDASPLCVLSPVIITAIPVFDAAVVVIKRLLRGKPIYLGDRNHISHRLMRLGYSPRATLTVVIALQIALTGSAFSLRLGDQVAAIVVLAQDAAILLAVVMLETIRDRNE
jgi:UDP-GlcNAc:undecaprenyl-phosphate GlcNAc-1-phosphate transferase